MPLLCVAQRYNFKIYSVNQGLPHAQVHDVYQTSDGYIWIATNGGGLSRFDGKNFNTYTSRDGLPSDVVNKLFEDSKGNLWIAGNPGGVVTFEGDSLVNPFRDDSLSKYEVWQIKEFSPGELWFGTYQGGIFIRKDSTFQRLNIGDGLISNDIWDFAKGPDGLVWVATEKGLSVLQNGKPVEQYTTDDGLSGNRVYKIEQGPEGTLWFATNNGITKWDGSRFQTITSINEIPLEYVFDIKRDSKGSMWVATEKKGVFIFQNGKFSHLTKNNGLSSNYIYSLYEDTQENMWIATDENGVSLYRGQAFAFYDQSAGLISNAVLSIEAGEDGTIWMGTEKGIDALNGNEVTHYSLPGEYDEDYVWEIAILPNGNPIFLMPDNSVMELVNGEFRNFSASNGLGDWFIYDIYVDSAERLWIGTDEGLYILDNGQLEKYTMEDGLAGNVIQAIYEDPGQPGTMLIGTTYGLSIFDGESFQNFRITDGLNHEVINYITKDDNGNIWLATGGGVSVMKPAQEGFEIDNFSRDTGMELINSHFIWFDKEGFLWQGTNAGLNRLNVPKYWETGEMTLQHYSLSKQGPGVEFNFRAIAVDDRQNTWFGSMDGALKLDVSKLRTQYPETPPAIQITNIRRNSKPIQWANYKTEPTYRFGQPEFPSISFPYGEHTYSFSFIGLYYRHPQNVEYRYKLKGFEKDWMPFTSDNTATYTNLKPGDYTFMVQARDETGRTYTEVASYSFTVAYPFWQTYWFWSLIALSVFGLFYGAIKIRDSFYEKRRLEELVDEQTRYLQEALEEKEVLIKEIHHRVKNNLAVISGLLELQMGNADDEFVNRVLSESQRRVQSISMIHEKLYQNERLAEIDFVKYVQELIDIISYSFGYEDKEINVHVDIDEFKLGVDQGIPCGLILNELVSNAYEHAFKDRRKGNIEIIIREHATQEITITVRDDGRGLPEGFNLRESDSLGLTLVKTLSKQLEATLEMKDRPKGTEFTLSFSKKEAPLKIPVKE